MSERPGYEVPPAMIPLLESLITVLARQAEAERAREGVRDSLIVQQETLQGVLITLQQDLGRWGEELSHEIRELQESMRTVRPQAQAASEVSSKASEDVNKLKWTTIGQAIGILGALGTGLLALWKSGSVPTP
jgi:hypothetical protein